MGSTYHSLQFHWVCSTKERRPWIRPSWAGEFHGYLGGIIRGLGGTALKVGGVEDHLHALIALKTTHCIADVIRELKKSSSRWIASEHESRFQWQEGYSIFSVSSSGIPMVSRYIEDQPEHHRKMTFAEELEKLLTRHGIEYDPRYLL